MEILSFHGIQFIGITSVENKDTHKTIHQEINKVTFRKLLF